MFFAAIGNYSFGFFLFKMVKYRYLTDKELQEFEEEFKHFLIANGMHSEEWERLNHEDVDKFLICLIDN